MTSVFLLAGVADGNLLRDKYGDSIDGRLIVAEVAWPSSWLILIGALLSTVGAGLQSLTGAPRLLQAIAQDNLLPFLGYFGKAAGSGEPTRALVLTGSIFKDDSGNNALDFFVRYINFRVCSGNC